VVEVIDRDMDILLIEDNEGDVLLTKTAFAAGEIPSTIHVCKTGEQGMDFLRRKGAFFDAPRPHLVLLDLNLPGMSGKDVLHEIKESADLRTTPVIVMTSSRAESDIRQSYQMHANSYVVKPVRMNEQIDIANAIETFWFKTAKTPIS
jgi:two-component system, chemotaxis family, response regulator Rcp1